MIVKLKAGKLAALQTVGQMAALNEDRHRDRGNLGRRLQDLRLDRLYSPRRSSIVSLRRHFGEAFTCSSR